MLPLGLSSSEQALYYNTLASTHSIAVTLQLMDLNGNRLSNISNTLLDGQVNVDNSADITRTCSLSLLDPRRRLHFDSDSPADGALYLDRMIRVVYAVKVPTLGWVGAPVFTGPVSSVSRQDDVLNVELQGKESLAMGAGWSPRTFKKGHRKVGAAKQIMQDLAGETKFSFPELGARLHQDLSLSRVSVPWTNAKRLAHSMDQQLFYDGRGVLRMRDKPAHPTFHLKGGNGGVVLTEPQVTYSTEELKNLVWVKGGKPKGEKLAISYWQAAPRAHPLSPWKLARNGAPRYLVEVINNPHVRTKAEAQKIAQTRLAHKLLEHVDVTLDVLPLPMLDPLDVLRITTDELSMTFRLKSFSLPLTAGEPMSLGYTKRVSVYKGKGRGPHGDTNAWMYHVWGSPFHHAKPHHHAGHHAGKARHHK